LEDKLELHKQVLKRISDELEKLKHAEGNLPEVNFFIYKLISIFYFFYFTSFAFEWIYGKCCIHQFLVIFLFAHVP